MLNSSAIDLGQHIGNDANHKNAHQSLASQGIWGQGSVTITETINHLMSSNSLGKVAQRGSRMNKS